MGKLGCRCGHVISDGAVPNEVTGSVLSDKSEGTFFAFVEATIAAWLEHLQSGRLNAWRTKHLSSGYPADTPPVQMLVDVMQSRFADLTLALMACDACGRLHVQRAPSTQHYRGYHPDPEEDGIPHVLGPVDAAE